ncbi:MAG: hypothetical protein KAH68_03965 [Draconibacterium sp.]|nr:hypothetical protein [Draconibacterium sp.]
MNKFLLRFVIISLIGLAFILRSTELFSQERDTTKALISTIGSGGEFELDTIVEHEVSPLDISKDRGLYIKATDGKMQLRILGSVRFSALYDMVEMPVKNTFNTYYVPTGHDNIKIPNYYNSLNQSRLGFEITRKLENTNVFIRLETDFNGPEGQYRIRHAYGQIDNFLVGQTWSLFSNVSSMPPTVDGNGPTGSVTLRTPQIRYRGKGFKGIDWSVALEYSQPDLNPQESDSLNLTTVQMIPDFTARIQRKGFLGDVQLSLIATTVTTKDIHSKISNSFGMGTSLSGTIDLKKKHKILYQLTAGRSISHFITTFNGTGQDAAFNPETNKFESLSVYSGFVSYGFDLKEEVTTNFSIGSANQINKSFQPNSAFKNSFSFSVDTFWKIIEGARIGLEYVYGQRWDKDGTNGEASRIWALFYYDF